MASSTIEELAVRPYTGKEEIFKDVPSSMTIRNFKKLIASRIGVKPEYQKLLASGTQLEDRACDME